jgi:hypothetical protein
MASPACRATTHWVAAGAVGPGPTHRLSGQRRTAAHPAGRPGNCPGHETGPRHLLRAALLEPATVFAEAGESVACKAAQVLKPESNPRKDLNEVAHSMVQRATAEDVAEPGTFDTMAFLDSPHCTAKTSTFAVVVPCGGTATKYSFSCGTNKPVLPNGPVGIFPMA